MADRARIVTPVSSPDEVEVLAMNGAEEFYCGILPDIWRERYGAGAWLNRRGTPAANLRSIAELSLLVQKAHRCSIPVSVALNAPYYTGDQVPQVLDIAKQCCDVGVNGLIVADPGLILALRELGLNVAVIVSSVAAVHNPEAARFFGDMGATRIILPRHMNLSEIRRIREGADNLEYEVFVLNDGCVYEEGLCCTTHAMGPFCLTEWRYTFHSLNGATVDRIEKEKLSSNVSDYMEWMWYVNNCGCTFSTKGLPNGPCGLCAVYDLSEMGIQALKIVGREASTHRKVKSLQMVRPVVDAVRKGLARHEICSLALDIRSTEDLCHSGYMCYYREVRENARGAVVQ